MMKPARNPSSIRFLALLAILVVLVSRQAVMVGAATCNPSELSPCILAITSSARPSGPCCTKLKEQRPCLCGYISNPSLAPYVGSPNAKIVAAACGVSIPSC